MTILLIGLFTRNLPLLSKISDFTVDNDPAKWKSQILKKGKLVSPSSAAIRMSWTLRLLSSVNTFNQNFVTSSRTRSMIRFLKALKELWAAKMASGSEAEKPRSRSVHS